MIRKRAILFAAILALSAPHAALANETGARAALAKAFMRATTESQGLPRLAFTETVAEKGVIVSARYNPARTKGKSWSPVSAVASEQEWASYRGIVHDTPNERDLLLNRIAASVSGPGQLISEGAGAAVFDFPLSPQARPTNSILDSALNLSGHIRLQLTVDETRGAFSAMRFYAPAPFAATPLARVQRVTLEFSFGPSYPGGPIVVHQIDTDAAYDVVGVNKLMRDTVWFKDVAPAPNAPPLTR